MNERIRTKDLNALPEVHEKRTLQDKHPLPEVITLSPQEHAADPRLRRWSEMSPKRDLGSIDGVKYDRTASRAAGLAWA